MSDLKRKLWHNGAPSWAVVWFVMWLGWVAVVIYWAYGSR